MATSSSKVILRRTEVRRQRNVQTTPLRKRLRDQVGFAIPSIGLGFCVLATMILMYGQDPLPYYKGQEVRSPIYARVRFKITDEDGTKVRKAKARQETPNYYVLNTGLIERIRGRMSNLFNAAKQYSTYEEFLTAREQSAAEDAQDGRWDLDPTGFAELHALADEAGQARFTAWIDATVDQLKHERLVRRDDDVGREVPMLSDRAVLSGALPNEGDTVADANGNIEVDTLTLDYFAPSHVKDVQRVAQSAALVFPEGLRQRIHQLLLATMSKEPLFRFDLERTRDAMNREAASVDEVKMTYDPHNVLAEPPSAAGAGGSPAADAQRTVASLQYKLTTAQVSLLRHEHDQFMRLLSAPLDELPPDEQQPAQQLRRQHHIRQVGLGALVVMVTLGLATYCVMFASRVVRNPMRALSVAVLFLIMMAVARAMYLTDIAVRFPHSTIAPVVMTAAILTMAYSQRFAIGMTCGLTLLVTPAIRGELWLLVALIASMAVSVYQLREIRSRYELYSTGLLNALGAFIAVLVTVLVSGYSVDAALRHAGSASVAAVMAIAVFSLMLPPIERIFNVATNWTLLELLDTSRPLLSRLAHEAPGTFAHSLWLSSMAEAACEAIGANGLLAKVGAMYHDIGKVHKAEYFAENQEAHINRHEKLAPTMSLLVIVGHVKDGVELAKEERLPSAIVRFIQEHHGTTVVRYFHHVASEQQKAAGNPREVSEAEFRYPGPKPQSKETAVLMLCDGVEGAVRALQEPTAGRIENVVHSVLMDRLNDGQFDDCDITLKELHKVENSLVKSLCRFYHGRVAYPKAPSGEKAG